MKCHAYSWHDTISLLLRNHLPERRAEGNGLRVIKMNNPSKKPETLSREERQVAVTVQSAQGVLREIEGLRKVLSDDAQPQQTRRDAKHDMLEASERLCNLMGLAVYQIANGVSGEFQGRMKASLDALRGRLLDMGTNLMVEKLEKIRDRAEAVLEGRNYPIGLAAKLDLAYSGIVDNLRTLNAENRMGDELHALITTTEKDIRTLAEIEHGLGVMDEMAEAASGRRYAR